MMISIAAPFRGLWGGSIQARLVQVRPVLIGLVLIGLLASCAGRELPPPALELPPPAARLSFDRVEAGDPVHITLSYLLELENPRDEAAVLEILDWNLAVRGFNPPVVEFAAVEALGLLPGSSGTIPLRFSLDLTGTVPPVEAAGAVEAVGAVEAAGVVEAASGDAVDSDAAEGGAALSGTDLRLALAFRYGSGERIILHPRSSASFPLIREPRFSITAIAVQRAELINTRFKVTLRIENPNAFPVELASFRYELYGGGRFWAEGEETGVLHIPAGSAAETELFLIMNFINMRRELLDQIIALRQVNYRFTGEAVVSTGIEYLPQFRMNFERSGYSEVIE
jgi:LEA14-like dessication related protein